MKRPEYQIRKANIDNRIRAIVMAISKLKDLSYATEHLTVIRRLSIMLAEQEAKMNDLNSDVNGICYHCDEPLENEDSSYCSLGCEEVYC